jgi:multidrug efflux pump subunit AcrB
MDRPFLRGEGVRRQAPALYALSLLIVFLCLAALYESWSVPIAVLLVVPLGVVGAVLSAHLPASTTTSISRSA